MSTPDQTGAPEEIPTPPAGVKSGERPVPLEAVVPGKEYSSDQRYELRILRAIRRIMRSTDLYSKRLEAQHGVTTPQLLCLLTLANAGSMTLTGLAREVHMGASSLVGILDRLEEKRLVARVRGTGDRRVIYLNATPAGLELVRSVPAVLQHTLARGLSRLPELEQVAIALSLERVVELMEAQDFDAAPVLESGPLSRP